MYRNCCPQVAKAARKVHSPAVELLICQQTERTGSRGARKVIDF